MLVIEPSSVRGIEPVHGSGEVGLGCLNDEMEVIGHQDTGGEAPAEAVDDLGEEGEEGLAISVGAEDGFALVAARGEVIDGAGIFDAKGTCHSTAEDPSGSSYRRGFSSG